MKFHFITSHFHVLIRTIATTLDTLILKSINISCEIKEFVYLVVKLSQKAKLEIDSDDKDCLKIVILILDHFED